MKAKAPLSALLVTILSATLLLHPAYAYENTQYGFSINPPEGWAIEESTGTDNWREAAKFTKESTFQTTQPFTINYHEWRIRWYLLVAPELGMFGIGNSTADEPQTLLVHVYNYTSGTWFESIKASETENTSGTLYIQGKGKFYIDMVSAAPNYTIVIEQKMPLPSFVFREPSNSTGATITVSVNQSGLPQDDPFLASHTHRYLRHYLAETYEGYLITQMGARVVSSLNGYQIKFNASVSDSEMRFDSAIFLLTNQTFYIVCGALSSEYDNLSLDFKESIDSFRIAAPVSQGDTNSTPHDNAAMILIGVISAVFVLVTISLLLLFKRRRQQLGN